MSSFKCGNTIYRLVSDSRVQAIMDSTVLCPASFLASKMPSWNTSPNESWGTGTGLTVTDVVVKTFSDGDDEILCTWDCSAHLGSCCQ